MKKLILLLGIILLGQSVFALDVVYPKKQIITINSPTTFFIGSAAADLTVNGVPVKVSQTGGFAHFVNLKEGENIFEIKSTGEVLVYKITRPAKSSKPYTTPKFIEYSAKKTYIVKDDNSPLRSTPVDGGANRIAHLQEGVILNVDGEKGTFFRVSLGENKKAWIGKSYVEVSDEVEPATILAPECVKDKNYYVYKFHLDRKVPFEMIEGQTFYLKFYNIKDCPQNNYVFEFPYSKYSKTDKIVGYSGKYEGNDFVLKVRKYPEINPKHPLKGITIAVDAGHGGSEIGAIGCLRNYEKDLTLKIAKQLEHELKHRGANVVMTRKEDVDVPLYKRVEIANENEAMFFISIHGNALPDSMNPNEHRGTSIYYYYDQAKLLAANVLNSIIEQVGTQNDKIRQESFAVVRNTEAVSILIETAYMINPEDNEILIDPFFKKRCAKAIADGIENYLLQK